MKENLSEEELAKVDDEIKRLDDAFTRLKPKVVPRIAEFVTDKDRWEINKTVLMAIFNHRKDNFLEKKKREASEWFMFLLKHSSIFSIYVIHNNNLFSKLN